MSERAPILIIDDNPTDLKLISSVLSSQGYDVSTANEAPVGIEKVMELKPALIVLDVMMPIINGYNICRLLKDQKDYADIPIVLLTSRVTEEDKRIGQEVGADAYVTKPFKTEELLETIQRFLTS